MGNHRAIDTGEGKTDKESWAKAAGQPKGADRDIICVEDGHSVGRLAPRDGMRVRDELLAALARMAGSRGVGEVAQNVVGETAGEREDRLDALSGGQFIGARGFGAKKPGQTQLTEPNRGRNTTLLRMRRAFRSL